MVKRSGGASVKRKRPAARGTAATAARKRANNRLRRQRGEIGLKTTVAAALAGGLFLGGLSLGAVLGVTLDRTGLLGPAIPDLAELAALAPAAGPEEPVAEDPVAEAPAAVGSADPIRPEDVKAKSTGDVLPAPEPSAEARPEPGFPARPRPAAEALSVEPRVPARAEHYAADGPSVDGGIDRLAAEPDSDRPRAATPGDDDWTIPVALRRRALHTLDANGVPVVYEEPFSPTDPMLPPSERELDSFVEDAGLKEAEETLTPSERPLAWQANAVPFEDSGGRPMIALVLDDVGLNRPNSRRAAALPGPLTLAFMTYAEKIDDMLATARRAGHELLVHMPMQPRDTDYNPGPNALIVGLDEEELARRIDWGLSRFEGFVGVNNHMGSLFTTSLPGMGQVMAELKQRGLLYLDSKTAGASVGSGLALRLGVPYAERDVFIDNDHRDKAAIRRQLEALEATARRRGYAVGIGHPHTTTLDVLGGWLADVEQRGFALVPISAVVKRRIEMARSADRAG